MAKKVHLMTLSEVKETIDKEFIELITGWSSYLDTADGDDAVNLSVTFRNEVDAMVQFRETLIGRFSELMEDDDELT